MYNSYTFPLLMALDHTEEWCLMCCHIYLGFSTVIMLNWEVCWHPKLAWSWYFPSVMVMLFTGRCLPLPLTTLIISKLTFPPSNRHNPCYLPGLSQAHLLSLWLAASGPGRHFSRLYLSPSICSISNTDRLISWNMHLHSSYTSLVSLDYIISYFPARV